LLSVSPVHVAAGTSISVLLLEHALHTWFKHQAVTLANVASVATSSKVITGIWEALHNNGYRRYIMNI
jgi:hypothetical protein